MSVHTIEEMYAEVAEAKEEFDSLFSTWGIWSDSTLGHAATSLSLDKARQIGNLTDCGVELTHIDEEGYVLTNSESPSMGIRYEFSRY